MVQYVRDDRDSIIINTQCYIMWSLCIWYKTSRTTSVINTWSCCFIFIFCL